MSMDVCLLCLGLQGHMYALLHIVSQTGENCLACLLCLGVS